MMKNFFVDIWMVCFCFGQADGRIYPSGGVFIGVLFYASDFETLGSLYIFHTARGEGEGEKERNICRIVVCTS